MQQKLKAKKNDKLISSKPSIMTAIFQNKLNGMYVRIPQLNDKHVYLSMLQVIHENF